MLSNQFQESRKGAHVNFELWLEFERWTSDYDVHDEFFNMLITLDDGRKYALNVWTYSFIERARAHDVQNAERLGGLYLNPPDLLVERAERDVCEKVVQHLIATDGLLLEWFVPDEEEPAEEKVSVDLAEESSEPLGQLAHGYWPAQPCVHDVTWRAMWRLNKQEKVERFVRKLSRRLNLPLELLQCERHHSDHGLWNVRLGSPAMEGFPLQMTVESISARFRNVSYISDPGQILSFHLSRNLGNGPKFEEICARPAEILRSRPPSRLFENSENPSKKTLAHAPRVFK